MSGQFRSVASLALYGLIASVSAGLTPSTVVAQELTPPDPRQSISEIVSDVATIQPPAVGRTFVAPEGWNGRTEVSPLSSVIWESIFGEADPNLWRPLTLSTLFSEGWREDWVPSPNGSGGAPRQGWINAVDGNMYRLWFFTFAQGFNDPPKGNAYLGSFTIYTPFSRRFELITNVPFYLRNNAVTGLPIIDPNQPAVTTTKSHSGFGDLSFTPRVLLHETQDFSLTTELSVSVPTGTQPVAGNTTALTPAVGFWNNFAGR